MNGEMLAQAVHDFSGDNPAHLVCALVYGVGNPALYSEFVQWFGTELAASRLALIFDARHENGSEQYGPFLVRLASGATQPSKLLMRLANCCVMDPRSISFLFSSLEFDQLAAALRERLDVVCEDRSEWQMKYFDTRSLGVLKRTLSEEQKIAFFSIAAQWWYLDRASQLRRIQGAGATVDSYRGPLTLSEQQAKAFIEAGLPDSVLYTLNLTDSDLMAEFDARTRYEICERTLLEATSVERDSALLLADRVRAALMDALDESP
jgi:hypothetical protein